MKYEPELTQKVLFRLPRGAQIVLYSLVSVLCPGIIQKELVVLCSELKWPKSDSDHSPFQFQGLQYLRLTSKQ